MTAPMLPIPFTAADLAAFMLDGAGAMIPEALECHIGGHVDESPRLPSPNDSYLRFVREALQTAYALAAQAMTHVGVFDHAEEARAYALQAQYSEANGLANEREGVFDWNATEDEKRGRRARAVASVADLKEQAKQALSEVDSKWRNWRGAMVRQLLNPPQESACAAPKNAPTDFTILATRQQLIDAFGAFSGMNADWFRNLKDSPALLAARKVKGQGGRSHIAEPYFCPLEVMQSLINPVRRRREGRRMSESKGWELLEQYFPKVYATNSVGDPREG